MKIPLPSDFITLSGMKQASNRLAANDANQPRCLLRRLHSLVQVSRYAAGVVPVDASIRQIHSRSAITLTAPHTIHKSLVRLWLVYRLMQIYPKFNPFTLRAS
jgi:hypothetical protein